jgi:protein BCP1
MDTLNVDFEWFDPNPTVDFHGLKTLLRQLLDVDNQLFNLSELADLILSQPLLGSTVKCDGTESDPFSFLTVLNLETHKVGGGALAIVHMLSRLTVHQDKQVIADLTAYLARHSTAPALAPLQTLLTAPSTSQIGLILTERFINMPHEIVAPSYKMLQEEIQWALDEKEPYAFTHYLVLSKAYMEVESNLPAAEQPPAKKKKAAKGDDKETFYFHPEDEVLHKHALGYGSFEFESPVDEGASDSKRAFQEMGVKPMGHLILIEADQFAGAVSAVESFLGGGQ